MHYVNTGLYAACEIGSLELVKYFVEQLGAWNINYGLYYACVRSVEPNISVIKYLLQFDATEIIPNEIINKYKYKEVKEFLELHNF
jgi:hypothetical protein